MSTIYDVVIIGSGPAGLSAGIYSARAKMTTLILEKSKAGGQIVTTDEVANYPGSIEEATGPSLTARMIEQCEAFGVERKKEGVISLDLEGSIKSIVTEKASYKARSVIIATGATPRMLDVLGEKELTGKGVSYCATCDADIFTDLEVFVIGGGDTAVEEAIFLTRFARKVTIVHRRDKFRAAKSIVDKAMKNEKIDIIWNATVEEIKGEGIVESIVLKNRETGEVTEYNADEDDGTFGAFVFVGYLPNTELFKSDLILDKAGYIVTDENMKTNIEGVFAAGDVRVKSLRQVVTAAADGAVASVQAEKYIEDKFH